MKIKNIMLAGFGFVFLALGAIGVVLPLIPTTPFVLLSVACFSGTPKMREKVMKIKFFREHVENYEKRTGLSRKSVIISLVWLWGMLILSTVMTRRVPLAVMFLGIGTAVTAHILWMARPDPEKVPKTKQEEA